MEHSTLALLLQVQKKHIEELAELIEAGKETEAKELALKISNGFKEIAKGLDD